MEKFLPISVRDFEQMIAGNFVYIDKTRYIYEMARVPQAYYFLSRPRRFGKSLLVSTLKALFEGRKELFKGLWIENSDWEWKPHPVVIIDFSEVNLSDAKTFELSLSAYLNLLAGQHEIRLEHEILLHKLVELLTKLHEKYREKVVVLIDEYDKPVTTHLEENTSKLHIAKENRDLLLQFLGVFKSSEVDSALRFLFLAGISRFSLANIYSGLNNLQNLTMNTAYSALLGFTEDEITHYFGHHIAKLAEKHGMRFDDCLEKLRIWYDGYRFSTENTKVYNPISILNTLARLSFKPYWFETGGAKLLVHLMKEKNYPIPIIENFEIQEISFSTYELENLRLEALLFQTGYVTIRDYDGFLYTLGYPNQEVKTSFSAYLYDNLVDINDTALKAQFQRLHEYLEQEDWPQFIETTNAILSAIPYTQHQEQGEAYYHTVFYLMVAASGVLVQTEALSSRGRMDIAVEFRDKVYVIELKCNQPAEKALAQIREKGYHEKYLQSGRKIFLLGIDFDTHERAIKDWRIETV